jgi:alanyl-tRNA synthetase
MPLPSADTIVEYPSGATASTGTVLHVEEVDGALAVVLDRTAFHPVDAHWPDQPADRGRLILADGTSVDIVDAQVGATDGERLHIGGDVPVRTGTPGWAFVVVHLVAKDAAVREGETVGVEVDAGFRTALSVGHTACHLASLALDRALAGSWTKPAPADPLGAPAFDQLAIERSEIIEHGARDTYRIGKSLRKKGFPPSVFDDPAAVADAVNEQLSEWVATDAPVRVETPEPGLGARRSWVCALPEGEARIPCGGTHVGALGALGRVAVAFEVDDADGARTVVMTTTAVV